MDWDKNLKALRAAIREQCNTAMERDRKVDSSEVASWALEHETGLVRAALIDLVGQAMEKREDDARVECILRHKPALQEFLPDIREISETLGVSAWYLLSLNDEAGEAAWNAAILIRQLRAAKDQAITAALQEYADRLRPIVDGHPGMTLGEAERLLKAQTDETIRGLEG